MLSDVTRSRSSFWAAPIRIEAWAAFPEVALKLSTANATNRRIHCFFLIMELWKHCEHVNQLNCFDKMFGHMCKQANVESFSRCKNIAIGIIAPTLPIIWWCQMSEWFLKLVLLRHPWKSIPYAFPGCPIHSSWHVHAVANFNADSYTYYTYQRYRACRKLADLSVGPYVIELQLCQ